MAKNVHQLKEKLGKYRYGDRTEGIKSTTDFWSLANHEEINCSRAGKFLLNVIGLRSAVVVVVVVVVVKEVVVTSRSSECEKWWWRQHRP